MRFLMVFLATLFISNLNAGEDMFGREVDTSDASKIYFVGPGALRLGVYLGLEGKIAGIDKMDTSSPAFAPYQKYLFDKGIARSAKIISQGGPGKLPGKEAVLKSGATLIVICDFPKDVVEKFATDVKIPVFALRYTAGVASGAQIKNAKVAITTLAKAVGKEKRAAQITAFMEGQEAALKAIAVPQKSVFVGALGFRGAHGITSSVNYYPPFALLGLKNALGAENSAQNQITVSYEALVKANPDFIFVDKVGKKLFSEEKSLHESVFGSLDAFKEGRVAELEPYNYYATNLENIYINAWQIAQILGAKVDFEAKKAEILKAFFED